MKRDNSITTQHLKKERIHWILSLDYLITTSKRIVTNSQKVAKKQLGNQSLVALCYFFI